MTSDSQHQEHAVEPRCGTVTSDVVADTSSEATPPGDDAPLKHLPIDGAGLYGDDWSPGVLKKTTVLMEQYLFLTFFLCGVLIKPIDSVSIKS